MINPKLSEREELVLQAVVQSYITSAEPVGSRAIVKRFSLDISPATVRNVMADLEELGFLEQLHTSSGRVPTDKGYRYYVDYLMRVQDVTLAERNRLEHQLSERLADADEILRQTSHLLALISHQTGIVESPNAQEARVKHIEIMPLQGNRVVMLLADTFGSVKTSVISMDAPLMPEHAARLGRFLNETVRGAAIDQIATVVRARTQGSADEQRLLAEQALKVMEFSPSMRHGQLFLDGATQLFEQPEFHNVEKARELFDLLDEHTRVVDLLRGGLVPSDDRRSRVVIGSEALQHGLGEISVVSAPYKIAGQTVGMVGILGPRRMPYSKLTGLVEYTAGMLGRLLTRLAG